MKLISTFTLALFIAFGTFAVSAQDINVTGTINKIMYVTPQNLNHPSLDNHVAFNMNVTALHHTEKPAYENKCNSWGIFSNSSIDGNNGALSMLLAAKATGNKVTATFNSDEVHEKKCILQWIIYE